MFTRTGLAAAALLATAACGSSPSAARVAGSTGRDAAAATSPAAQRTRAWLDFAACARAHGASLPDPSFDQDGNPQWPVDPKSQPKTAFAACASSLQAGSTGKAVQAPTAADLARLTRFAQCVRQHGVPNFPDPDPQTGSFDSIDKSSPSFQAAAQACRPFLSKSK